MICKRILLLTCILVLFQLVALAQEDVHIEDVDDDIQQQQTPNTRNMKRKQRGVPESESGSDDYMSKFSASASRAAGKFGSGSRSSSSSSSSSASQDGQKQKHREPDTADDTPALSKDLHEPEPEEDDADDKKDFQSILGVDDKEGEAVSRKRQAHAVRGFDELALPNGSAVRISGIVGEGAIGVARALAIDAKMWLKWLEAAEGRHSESLIRWGKSQEPGAADGIEDLIQLQRRAAGPMILSREALRKLWHDILGKKPLELAAVVEKLHLPEAGNLKGVEQPIQKQVRDDLAIFHRVVSNARNVYHFQKENIHPLMVRTTLNAYSASRAFLGNREKILQEFLAMYVKPAQQHVVVNDKRADRPTSNQEQYLTVLLTAINQEIKFFELAFKVLSRCFDAESVPEGADTSSPSVQFRSLIPLGQIPAVRFINQLARQTPSTVDDSAYSIWTLRGITLAAFGLSIHETGYLLLLVIVPYQLCRVLGKLVVYLSKKHSHPNLTTKKAKQQQNQLDQRMTTLLQLFLCFTSSVITGSIMRLGVTGPNIPGLPYVSPASIVFALTEFGSVGQIIAVIIFSYAVHLIHIIAFWGK